MDKLDYQKASRELYQPKTVPGIINVQEMKCIQIDGQGNPNEPRGTYQSAVEMLSPLSYTIKMSPKNNAAPKGLFCLCCPSD